MEAVYYNDLIDILETEYRHYIGLKELADKKREAIIDNDIEDLTGLIDREEQIIGDIQDMENKRTEIITNMTNETDLNPDKINFNHIIERSPENPKTSLINIKEKLLVVIDELHEQNQQNRLLIEEAMKLNNFSLNIMMKFLEPDSQTYDKKPGKKDRKKIAHIVDRKG